jgi:endophilin-A
VEELQLKTREFLQPNPTARAKMAAVKGISKLSGQAKASTYPQPEGVLGECMSTFGRKLGEDSVFGKSIKKLSFYEQFLIYYLTHMHYFHTQPKL